MLTNLYIDVNNLFRNFNICLHSKYCINSANALIFTETNVKYIQMRALTLAIPIGG